MLSQSIAMDPELVALIEKAKNHVMTPAERWAQRVSFVYGMLGFDNKMTKDEVEQKLIEIHGRPPA